MSGFTNPIDAIEYGKRTNEQRHKELGLDTTSVRNRAVVRFHWNFEQLILQFEDNVFLKIYLSHDRLNVSVEDKIDIQTNRFQAFNLFFSGTNPFFWNPSEIAKGYTGKIFENIYLGESELFLYFRGMPLLIHCCVEQDVTNNRLFLFWSESE